MSVTPDELELEVADQEVEAELLPFARSLDEFDLERLSADAKETLSTIAPLMAETRGAKDQAAWTAEQLGMTPKAVRDAMALLREELSAQKTGATLPELRDEEYEALKESMLAFGQLTPILYDDRSGEIVDGAHRKRACDELGLEPWMEPVRTQGMNREIGVAVNTVRRQLTAEQRKRIVVAELLFDPKASDRSIAAIAGLSPTTVGKVRAGLQKRGLVSSVDTRRRSDGREGAHPPVGAEPKLLAVEQSTDTEKGLVTFVVPDDVVKEMLSGWSKPVQIRLVEQDDGTYELWGRDVE